MPQEPTLHGMRVALGCSRPVTTGETIAMKPIHFAFALVLLPFAVLDCSASSAPAATAESDSALSATGERQMQALLETARRSAEGARPRGRCYASVARYIDTVGYGKMPVLPPSERGSLPSVPDAFGAEAHMFADFMNETDPDTGHSHADDLGLQRLAIDNPYRAPAGSIVVVRAGTPGTAHPTAGDITVAGSGGKFYNDGEMGYGGSDNFPSGNDFVLGVYAPKTATASGPQTLACGRDEDCTGGSTGTERVCATSLRYCIVGCHSDDDCPSAKTCEHTTPHYSCQ
jgi:hypothetical protein